MPRVFAATILALAAVTSLASSTLAAGATTLTLHDSFQHTDEHENEAYTFDVQTVAHITIRPDGTTSITNNTRQTQTHTVGGVVVDVITSNMAQHSLVNRDETILVSHTSGHDRYSSDEGACQTTTIWQVIDNELVLAQFHSVCR